VAYVFWLLMFRRLPGRNAILALLIAALLAARPLPHGVGLALLLEKGFLYGGLIWLLHRAGMRLVVATLAAILVVLATSLPA
jgi:hypothetical protein